MVWATCHNLNFCITKFGHSKKKLLMSFKFLLVKMILLSVAIFSKENLLVFKSSEINCWGWVNLASNSYRWSICFCSNEHALANPDSIPKTCPTTFSALKQIVASEWSIYSQALWRNRCTKRIHVVEAAVQDQSGVTRVMAVCWVTYYSLRLMHGHHPPPPYLEVALHRTWTSYTDCPRYDSSWLPKYLYP